MFIRTISTTLLQIFVKMFIIPMLLSKIAEIQTTLSRGTLNPLTAGVHTWSDICIQSSSTGQIFET